MIDLTDSFEGAKINPRNNVWCKSIPKNNLKLGSCCIAVLRPFETFPGRPLGSLPILSANNILKPITDNCPSGKNDHEIIS